MFNNHILAISYRFTEYRLYVSHFTVVGVVVVVVLGFVYSLSLAGRLPQRGAFIYYCVSFRLYKGGQAALASAGIGVLCITIECLYFLGYSSACKRLLLTYTAEKTAP